MYSLLLPVGLIALCSRTTAFSSQRQRAISEDDENSYPNCGSCWCIPANNGTGPCPRWEPSSIFRNLTIEAYKGQTPLEIFQLPCNPYEDATCTTEPEQEMVDIESAVCAYQFEDGRGNSIPSLLAHRNDDINATDDAITAHYGADATTDLAPNEHEYVNGIIVDCAMKYRMITYASRAEAEAAGGVVTHTGACGVCSTTQDLALYLTEDFTASGKVCATKGLLLGEEAGLDCYMSIGLTRECAKIWNYDGIYDGRVCTSTCLGLLTAPNNGPPPACEINDCLQCDEEKAGPLFSAFAGRTRRRSGLRSEIIRDCDSIARIVHHNPCIHVQSQ